MKTIRKILPFVAAVLFVASCTKEEKDFLEVSTETLLVYGPEAKQLSLSIMTGLPWVITTDGQEWYSLDRTQGEGNAEITVSVEESQDMEIRSGSFTIKAGALSCTVNVEQNRLIGLLLGQDLYEIKAIGGKALVGVVANIYFNVEVPANVKSWLTVANPVWGYRYSPADENLTFYATRNFTGEERTAVVRIYAEDYGIDETVTLKQLTDGKTEEIAEGSNCYMLRQGDEKEIPISRLNMFWQSGDGGSNEENVLGPDDEWVVDVIWQDMPDPNLIRFLDDDGNEVKQAAGRGFIMPFRVKANGAKGNVVVGLHRKDTEPVAGNFLWSWHIWITDYNPDAWDGTPVDGQYAYTVPGGEVHRYDGDEWIGGIYSRSVIMDRNLGAFKTTWGGYDDLEGLIYYQRGRKDPFPFVTKNSQYPETSTPAKIYDMDGKVLPDDHPNSPMNISFDNIIPRSNIPGVEYMISVLNPTTLYYRGRNNLSWSSNLRHPPYLWNSTVSGGHRKSIYDPCPEGWKVPERKAFSDFVMGKANPTVSESVENCFHYTPLGQSSSLASYPGIISVTGDGGKTVRWEAIYAIVVDIELADGCLAIYSDEVGAYTYIAADGEMKALRCIRDTDGE